MAELLPSSWAVPQIFRDRLGTRVGRQRAMSADGHLLLVLHKPPTHGDECRSGRFFWRQPDGTWSSTGLGSGPSALRTHVREYAARVDALEKDLALADTPREHWGVVQKLGPLHRAAGNLHTTLQHARDLFPVYRDIIDFRDEAYAVHRDADLLYHLAKDGLELATARQSEALAESSHRMSVAAHRLNMLAAFFFPIVTLGTVFGMNFLHGYEQADPPGPFVVVIGVGLALGLVLTGILAAIGSRARRPERRVGPAD